jgi:hypothetical protein
MVFLISIQTPMFFSASSRLDEHLKGPTAQVR